jgi:hypothetical protein
MLLLPAFVVCLLVATRCGETPAPSPILSGMYGAWVPPGHSDDVYLQLESSGGKIAGPACLTLEGYLEFSDVPVQGSCSNISFTVPPSHGRGCAKDHQAQR